MIKLQDLLEQKFKECPPATQDVDLNTKNRDDTVKTHNDMVLLILMNQVIIGKRLLTNGTHL